MSKLRCHISISLDGFVAGLNQSEENPLGEGGERLHDWVVPLAAWRQSHGEQRGEVNESARIVEESRENIGAAVMGRNMFGPVHGGAWGDEQWTGWWGDNPPYHYPVFILTHYPRDPVEMEGGTTFHFVTDGIESALEQARKAAGGKDVMLWGGAHVVQQYLAAGLLDELELHVVPVRSARVLVSSTTSGTRRCSSSRSGPSRRPASPTSSTGWWQGLKASSGSQWEANFHSVAEAVNELDPMIGTREDNPLLPLPRQTHPASLRSRGPSRSKQMGDGPLDLQDSGAEIAPSCRSRARSSRAAQCSAIKPSAIRKMWM